jgi:hypothetical protein
MVASITIGSTSLGSSLEVGEGRENKEKKEEEGGEEDRGL